MEKQGPDQFNSLEQDVAGDVDDDSYVAPDEPMGVHAYGTTVAEQRSGETFDQRSKHTNPEFDGSELESDERKVGRMVQPGDEDVDLRDDEATVIALDQGSDDDMSAEERAMHETDF